MPIDLEMSEDMFVVVMWPDVIEKKHISLGWGKGSYSHNVRIADRVIDHIRNVTGINKTNEAEKAGVRYE